MSEQQTLLTTAIRTVLEGNTISEAATPNFEKAKAAMLSVDHALTRKLKKELVDQLGPKGGKDFEAILKKFDVLSEQWQELVSDFEDETV